MRCDRMPAHCALVATADKGTGVFFGASGTTLVLYGYTYDAAGRVTQETRT